MRSRMRLVRAPAAAALDHRVDGRAVGLRLARPQRVAADDAAETPGNAKVAQQLSRQPFQLVGDDRDLHVRERPVVHVDGLVGVEQSAHAAMLGAAPDTTGVPAIYSSRTGRASTTTGLLFAAARRLVLSSRAAA